MNLQLIIKNIQTSSDVCLSPIISLVPANQYKVAIFVFLIHFIVRLVQILTVLDLVFLMDANNVQHRGLYVHQNFIEHSSRRMATWATLTYNVNQGTSHMVGYLVYGRGHPSTYYMQFNPEAQLHHDPSTLNLVLMDRRTNQPVQNCIIRYENTDSILPANNNLNDFEGNNLTLIAKIPQN